MGATVTERLVNRLARRTPSRRGFLAAATVGGAALAVDPVGYLTKPQSAYASVCGPGARCNEGWSAMCCSINNGHNACPPGTFAGGWWKADRSSYCGGAARYYIDCNASRGSHWRCHCNTGSCDQRRVACNIFRYGQCNTQIPGVTAVVCRQISCRPPWELYPNACGRSSATDNATAEHNAPCLTRANTHPALPVFPAAPATLAAGHVLHTGQRLTSADRHTTLVFGRYGDLFIRNYRGVIWESGTTGKAQGGVCRLKYTGELVILNRAGREVWSSNSGHVGARASMRIRDDSHLVIYDRSNPIWRRPR
ncbi:MAG: twin-arginine translocation signal domain-containing protein [Jatrophihabitantaceae bacterium]